MKLGLGRHGAPRFAAALIVALACAGLGACNVNEDANPARCDADRTCPGKLRCYRGYCIAGDASGPGMSDGGRDGGPSSRDGGMDAGADAGPPAPEPCETEGMEEDCYSGPAGTRILGTCRAGVKTCIDGFWSECIGEITPRPFEACDGRDDDCDEKIDEIGSLGSCVTAMDGICAEGQMVCNDGEGVCAIINTPGTEECNGLDDDCDGRTDEGEIAATTCYPSDVGCTDDDEDGVFDCLGVCKVGVRLCEDGDVQDCSGFVVPADDEDCTLDGGVADDDDCDGEIDEGCSCEGDETRDCYSGPAGTQDHDPCQAGTQACSEGNWGTCTGQVLPGEETCANMDADDDCDGTQDDIPGLGSACQVEGAMGRCAVGTRQCEGGELTCVGPEPRTETCDSTDDDCAGGVDEGFNIQEDEQNCGTCGNTCEDDAPTCCAGACVDTTSDEAHCGGCNQPCGFAFTCCSGTCVNLQNNPDHCSACGSACNLVTPCCRRGACSGLLGLGGCPPD